MKKLISLFLLFLVIALSWANTGHAGLDNYQYQINKAKTDAISTAAADATTKANNAQAAAISAAAADATTKANNAQSTAISTAAADATTKANAASAIANTANSTGNAAKGVANGLAGLDASSILTASHLGGRSIAGNGYQKLPGGLILQWGKLWVTATGGMAVTYPTAVTTTCAITATQEYNGSAVTGVGNITASGFTLYANFTSQWTHWQAFCY